MKILVINGSPKGHNSITLQTVLYLEMLHPQHHFEILDAGQRIKSLEKDFSPAAAAIASADLLLFSYPVYTFVVPCQLHRFVELMKSSGEDFSGKYATQLTTSKHFYDVTSHRFIQDNCQDMGLRYLRGLSADMEDLTKEQGRQDAEKFFQYIVWCMENAIAEPMLPQASPAAKLPVTSAPVAAKSSTGAIVIVADLPKEDTQLASMIERFQAVLPLQSRIVNIHDFAFRGGCLGCFHCAATGDCIYQDGFQELLRNEIQQADAIVIAFTIRDHSMGSLFKTYDDRQFCNGHRTVTMGKPFAYLISGNYPEEENLRTIVEGRAQVGGNYLSGVACDQTDPNGEIDAVAAKLAWAVENHYVQPSNFLGVGGMKIFRDLIYQMRGMMRADHRFYKSHGQYDFPQKHKMQSMLMYLVGAMIANPKLKAKMGNKMTEGMLMPYKKVLEQAKKK